MILSRKIENSENFIIGWILPKSESDHFIATDQRPLKVTWNAFNSERWAFQDSANDICFGIWYFVAIFIAFSS